MANYHRRTTAPPSNPLARRDYRTLRSQPRRRPGRTALPFVPVEPGREQRAPIGLLLALPAGLALWGAVYEAVKLAF